MTKISVIVPVYNAEKYLHRCVDSILAQTFTDFEVLLINDGSTDQSPAICDEYAAIDSRVRVFHEENGGVSSARNLGIFNSKGLYLFFVDSDDFLMDGFFQKLSEYIKDTKNDCLVFNGICINENTNKRKVLRGKFVTNDYSTVLDYCKENGFRGEVWLHLFKRSLAIENNILFSENIRYCEDQEFTIKLLSLSQKIVSVNIIGYVYSVNRGSAMQKEVQYNDVLDHFKVIDNLELFYKKHNMIDYRLFQLFSFNIILASVNFLYKSKISLLVKVNRYYRKYYLSKLRKYNFGVSKNIILLLLFVSFIPFVKYLESKR